MVRKHRKKRKKSNDSIDSSVNNGGGYKAGRYTSTPEQVSVSNVLKQANTVLYCNSEGSDDSDSDSSLRNLFSQNPDTQRNMASPPTQVSKNVNSDEGERGAGGGSTSNDDLLKYLMKIDGRMEGMEKRMESMEKRLDKLDKLDEKVSKFEKELNKLWTCVQDQRKQTEDRMKAVEEKVESADFNQGLTNDKLISMEKENAVLKDDLVYLQSQSMRNNLVFSNIEESARGVSENTEQKLREFLEKKMNIAKDQVDKMGFERVHRMGARKDGITRKIVAKFTLFKERELVRKQWKALDKTPYYLHEQFPKEVVAKRKQLVPKLKEAKKSGKEAWISYDTLYINGKAQRDDK